jgi:hypothetical protein
MSASMKFPGEGVSIVIIYHPYRHPDLTRHPLLWFVLKESDMLHSLFERSCVLHHFFYLGVMGGCSWLNITVLHSRFAVTSKPPQHLWMVGLASDLLKRLNTFIESYALIVLGTGHSLCVYILIRNQFSMRYEFSSQSTRCFEK